MAKYQPKSPDILCPGLCKKIEILKISTNFKRIFEV